MWKGFAQMNGTRNLPVLQWRNQKGWMGRLMDSLCMSPRGSPVCIQCIGRAADTIQKSEAGCVPGKQLGSRNLPVLLHPAAGDIGIAGRHSLVRTSSKPRRPHQYKYASTLPRFTFGRPYPATVRTTTGRVPCGAWPILITTPSMIGVKGGRQPGPATPTPDPRPGNRTRNRGPATRTRNPDATRPARYF